MIKKKESVEKATQEIPDIPTISGLFSEPPQAQPEPKSPVNIPPQYVDTIKSIHTIVAIADDILKVILQRLGR